MSGAITFWLVEALAHDGSSEVTLRYSDIGYVSRPGDTPSNGYFEPRLTNPGSLSRSIFASGTTKGAVEVGYGRVVLENADGELAALRGYGWGRRIRVWSITTRREPNKVAFSNAVLQFTGIVSHVEADYDTISLVIRDELGLLDVPLQDSRFDGTSTGATGIEGNANVQGQVKPMAFGAALRNITIPLVNASKEARGWNFDKDGNTKPTAAVNALRNAGATYTLSGTNHADLAALFAATVTSGQADTCIAESLLRTSGSVTGEITADVTIAPEVTNLLTYSEQFDNAAWNKIGSPTITANATTAPDENVTADRVQFGATATDQIFQFFTGSTATTYHWSFYAKSAPGAGAQAIRAKAYDGSTDITGPDVALTEGEWTRVEQSFTTVSTTSLNVAIRNGSGGNADVLVWGAMLIQGTAAKPYIKTEGSTVTFRCEATAARVAAAILAEHGYSIEPDSLLALDAKNNALVGAYFDREITILAAAQRVLESIGGYLIATASGTFRVGRFEAPSGPVRKAITEDIMLDGDGSALALLPTDDDGTGIPSYRLTASYNPNWTEQDANALAGSVSQDNRVLYSRPFLEVLAEDTGIQTKHPEARETFIDTLLNAKADAEAEATRRLSWEKSEKTRFRVPLPASQAKYDADDSTPLDIGDRVTLVSARFGFATATDFVVIGADQLFGDAVATLDVVNSSEW